MNASLPTAVEPVGFVPGLRIGDARGAYWLRQVMLRLRREICWLWRERGLQSDGSEGAAHLPPFADRLGSVLDFERYELDKRTFFQADVAAAWLGQQIERPEPVLTTTVRGSFAWVCAELELSACERFALAAALLPLVDSAAGTVIASCLNEATRTAPTSALVQRLWDVPEDCLALADTAHCLARHGVWQAPADWDAPLAVAAPVARQLLYPESALSPLLRELRCPADEPDAGEDPALAARLAAYQDGGLRLLPVLGAAGIRLSGVAAAFAAGVGLRLLAPAAGTRASDIATCCTLAWLRGAALYLEAGALANDRGDGHAPASIELPLPALPLTVFLACGDRAALKRLPAERVLPPLQAEPLDYRGRLDLWRRLLGGASGDTDWEDMLADCARRFRYEREEIESIARALNAQPGARDPRELLAACRAELDLGELAQPVTPRFARADLMLPPKSASQIDELIEAARNLTRSHHDWGTAQAWNESGLSALFSGPPGTGKTMAAEVIARELDVAMYRIDLSQVVNKYIGETEKNLRRLFDAADRLDAILFFDEADALFGKRTEVKDAHDRYANIEVGYLLERMERFKGLAILATNRRKDLDEAFLRRLRFAIEFPLPETEERRRIWAQSIPPQVDAAALDLGFLAQRFPLAGGHIRAIVFHACLQGAGRRSAPRLDMPTILRAVRREYDKLNRALSREQFGEWAQQLGDER